MAAGDLAATDIFSLGSPFHAQSSTVNTNQDITEVLASDGDIICQTQFNTVATATVEYEVCGDGALSLSLGDIVGGYQIRMIEASQEAGQAPRVTVEGVAYDGGETATENTYAVSLTFDADDVSTNALIDTGLDASAEATSITYRWEMELTTGMGSDGQVSFVVSRTPRLTYDESGIGTATSAPSDSSDAALILVSYENSDSNQEIDTYTASFTKLLVSTPPGP